MNTTITNNTQLSEAPEQTSSKVFFKETGMNILIMTRNIFLEPVISSLLNKAKESVSRKIDSIFNKKPGLDKSSDSSCL